MASKKGKTEKGKEDTVHVDTDDVEIITHSDASKDDADMKLVGDEAVASDTGDTGNSDTPNKSLDENVTVKKANWPARIGWSFALLLMFFIAGLFAEPYLRPTLTALGLGDYFAGRAVTAQSDQPQFQDEITAIKARLDEFEMRLSAVSGQETDVADAERRDQFETIGASLAELADRLDKVEQRDRDIQSVSGDALPVNTPDSPEINRVLERVDTLDAELAKVQVERQELLSALALGEDEKAAFKARIDELESAFNTLEADSIQASPRGRLLLAVGQLRRAFLTADVDGSHFQPIEADLALLPAGVQSQINPALENLKQLSVGELYTLDRLRDDFETAAKAALVARDKEEGRFFAGLFTVRRSGPAASGLDRVLDEVERHLVRGDVVRALEATLAIDGASGDALIGWRRAARSYVAIVAGLDSLQKLIVGGLN